jgi:hypothetical protein
MEKEKWRKRTEKGKKGCRSDEKVTRGPKELKFKRVRHK